MNLSRPLTSLIPSLDGEVLTVLAGAESDFTGMQVHRLLGKYSQAGVNKVLQKLSAQGIVNMRPSGNANLYELNRDHILAKYVLGVSSVRAEFFNLLSGYLNSWEIRPECVAVFGSAIRGDMKPESDIDFFVSRSDSVSFGNMTWRQQITSLSLNVLKWTGNSAQVFEVGRDDLAKELNNKSGIIYSIIDSAIVVLGPTDYLRKLRTIEMPQRGRH